MKNFICILFYFVTFNFTYSCFSNNGNGNVNSLTTTISPNVDGVTSTITVTTTSVSTTTIGNCASCTTNQITFTQSTSATTGDATFSNYVLDGEGCYTITVTCDASDSATAISFMQFNIDQGGPVLNGENVINAVLNCRNGQWVYIQPQIENRVITEVNCLRTD
uniref:C6 domain-containing protein n=1 Tax=Strongyloides venezuelensis TaxID=75913 RepID=A0A0K0FPT6_STRVS